ncbi:MAG: hypothetical protein U0350_07875 [Caldilineaceae bacterium]
MSFTSRKVIHDLFGRAVVLLVALGATACAPLIRPSGPVIMPSDLVAPDQAQRLFTGYCVDYKRGVTSDPDIRVQFAWRQTAGNDGFDSCGGFAMKTDSNQPAILLWATCSIADKRYNYIAPTWQVEPRKGKEQPARLEIPDPAGWPSNLLSIQLEWPVEPLIAQSQLVGLEALEKRPVLHYQSKDLELLARLGFKPGGFPPQQGQVDVWLAPALHKGETSYVAKYQIALTNEVSYDLRSFTLSHLNEPLPIQPPPQALEYTTKLNAALARGHAILPTCYACDIPLPPDGSIEPPNMMTSLELIINTPQAGAAIVAYYEQQLPKEGWQVKPETQGDDTVHLLLTRGAQQVSLQILFNQPAMPTRILASDMAPTQTISPTGDVVGLNQYCNP